MKHGSLFSGIGGFDLASEWMGWENVFHCELNEFGQKILKYYWPKAETFYDITKTDFRKYANKIDILTGGFPCQPYSQAGKRKGKEDDRHLWPEMLRAIREIQPSWVVGENVRGLINWNGGMVFDEVQADLEAEGYEVQPFLLPACAVNAPHRRDRIWFVAYSDSNVRCRIKNEKHTTEKRKQSQCRIRECIHNGFTTNTTSNGYDAEPKEKNHTFGQNNKQSSTQRKCAIKRFSNEWSFTYSDSIRRNGQNEWERQRAKKYFANNKANLWQNFPTQSPICGGDDGLSSKLDGITFPKWRNESIKGYGNAVVPQLVYQIFKAIEKYNYGISI